MIYHGQQMCLIEYKGRMSASPIKITKVGKRWAEITPDGFMMPSHRIDVNILNGGSWLSNEGACFIFK